ncbi:MAG: histidine phosphatase family protein [Caldilineales bacterium]|nr:histidine phosphatase family protein [Caldilineales bacterium]MCW5860648.1 histidine phosphatase family protein [Caldilineales bacterium]
MPPVLYLARHATPDWNRKDIPYDIPPGPSLVPQGQAEAAQLAAWLDGRGIRQVYASPMARARQTAAIVSAALGATLVEAPDLIESRRGETFEAIHARMQRFFAGIVADGDEPLAAVSHGFPIEVLLQSLGVGADVMAPLRDRFDHRNVIACAGAWEIDLSSPQAPRCTLAFTPAIASG